MIRSRRSANGARYGARSTAHLTQVFHALADGTRRDILRQLAGGESTVTELAAPTGLALATVSQHLTVLADAGLIQRRKVGKYWKNRLSLESLHEAHSWIDQLRGMWLQQFQALDDYLARRERGS